MKSTLVILVVELSTSLVVPHTLYLKRLSERGGFPPLTTIIPAVTCAVQSTLANELMPSEHGIVANGWYFKDLAEVLLWRQPNQLVNVEKI
jgi:predicted AlkP superfamily pyrophosphatase or phosphodiesterase